jgi:predicted nucleotidyltransferase component of viral defense system
MEIKIIEDRLRQYNSGNKREELSAFKEIAQEILLMALSRANFFKQGAFQGGTCLRILYGLQRYSEDLDFILYDKNPEFKWQMYCNEIRLEFESYGLSVEVKDRSEVNGTIKKAFLKSDSFGKVINLNYERNRADTQSITIKLEIDTNPPTGSEFENKLLDFPAPFSVISQSPPSLFSGKLHALLCRPYVKGRDWYDFTWYVAHGIQVNYTLLENALKQLGPWQNQSLQINKKWLTDNLREKVATLDWEAAKNDVRNFIKQREQTSIDLWDQNFFMHFVDKLEKSVHQ